MQSCLSLEQAKKIYSVEERFLNLLSYWIKRKKYGVERDGQIWIYNTLESWAKQLDVSVRTICTAIKSLKDQGKIKTAYLSKNKRNRTLFYTIADKDENAKKSTYCNRNLSMNCSMNCKMYIDTTQNINNKSSKSDKSEKILSKKEEVNSGGDVEVKPKTTTARDMLHIWNEILGKKEMMSKDLARFLVAAMKFRFKTLEAWRKFVLNIKDSVYLMSKRFKLFLNWALKFANIDRIMNGEFGCRRKEYVKNVEEIEFQEMVKLGAAVQSIESINESKRCKAIRKNILNETSLASYLTWFKDCLLEEINGDVFLLVKSTFKRDYISIHFSDVVSKYFDGVVVSAQVGLCDDEGHSYV